MSHYQNFEPPFEIPNSWEWCQVEDIFELNPKNSVSDTSLCGFIPMALVQDGFGFSHSYERRVWRDVKKGYSHFQNGDIGIAKISPCFENRKSTIFYGLPNGIGAGTTELTILRPIVVDAEFYLFLFQSIWYITEGTKDFTGVVGQQRVNKEIFTSLVIPIPPIAEQKRITTEIKRYFHFVELIEFNKETLIRNTLTTKSKMLELAMQGKLVPQDQADEPAAEMLKRINPNAKIITDNPHSWNIPETWCWCQLGDLFNHNTGKALNSSNQDGQEYEYITTSNVYWDRFELGSLKKMFYKDSEIDKCKVVKGDLLVCEGGDVGRSAIWNMDFPIMIQNHLHRLRPVSDGILASLYLYLFRLYKEKELIGGKGIALQGFSSNTLHKLVVPCIPKNEQKRIVAKIEELYSVLDEIETSLQS